MASFRQGWFVSLERQTGRIVIKHSPIITSGITVSFLHWSQGTISRVHFQLLGYFFYRDVPRVLYKKNCTSYHITTFFFLLEWIESLKKEVWIHCFHGGLSCGHPYLSIVPFHVTNIRRKKIGTYEKSKGVGRRAQASVEGKSIHASWVTKGQKRGLHSLYNTWLL